MEITFTKHALDRMKQRGITKEEVESTLLNPDVIRDAEAGRKTAEKRVARGIVEVVYRVEKNAIVVITCYWS